MLRLTVFIIALLLLAGAVEPSQAWFIALSVLSGLSLLWWGLYWKFAWYGGAPWRRDPFARKMARRFEREWAGEVDW